LIVRWSTTRSGWPQNVSHRLNQMIFRPTPPGWGLLTSGWAASTKAALPAGRIAEDGWRHSPAKAPDIAGAA
jgi:hypothetical protein